VIRVIDFTKDLPFPVPTTTQRVRRHLDFPELRLLLVALLLLLATVAVVHPLKQLLDVRPDDYVENHAADDFGPALATHLGDGGVAVLEEAGYGYLEVGVELGEEIIGGGCGLFAQIFLGCGHGG
ncbi:unnamed protein product, partial [Penicillium nalgiovense]